MKHLLRTLCLAVFTACAFALDAFAQNASLPYNVIFYRLSTPAGWTAVDNNGDGNTWTRVIGSGVGINAVNADDDWVSPTFSLEAGKSYQLTALLNSEGDDPNAKLTLLARPAGKETYTLKTLHVNPGSDYGTTEAVTYIPETTGDYQFLFHYYKKDAHATNPTYIRTFSLKEVEQAQTIDLPETTTEGYATYYAVQPTILPKGVTATTVTAAGAAGPEGVGSLSTPWQYSEDDVVPAKTAVLFHGEAHKVYTATLKPDDTQEAPQPNLLHGANDVDPEGLTYVKGTEVKYYILSYADHEDDGHLGFYWATDDGAAVEYTAPYAYLALDGELAASAKGFSFDPHATGISTAVTDEAGRPTAIYTLTGQRLSATSVAGLAKGIYIVSGRKVIVK